MIVAGNDEQETSMMVEHQASRPVVPAISTALLLGADRELDSSITIKSIVSHLFHFNLYLSTTKRCSKLLQRARDEDLKLSHTRDTRHETRERHQASKQATSNKNQQEPIDEGTKNSTSLPHQPLELVLLDADARPCPSNRYRERCLGFELHKGDEASLH